MTAQPTEPTPGDPEPAPEAPAAAGALGPGPGGIGDGRGVGGPAPGAGRGRDLHRACHGRMIGGVAAGVARSFDVDVTVVRVAAVVLALMGGIAVPLYLALWVILPEEGTDRSVLDNVLRPPRHPHPFAQPGGATVPGYNPSPHDHRQPPSAAPYGNWYAGWWRTPPPEEARHLRIGDAERSKMADQLSQHYAAGRLDDEEFGQRMERAMAAKTQGDLDGLLADLPPVEQPAAAPPSRRRGHPVRTVALLVLTVFVLTSIWSSWWVRPHAHVPLGLPSGIPWIAVAVGAFFLLRWERLRHRRAS